jgi:hypothetical protein
MLGGKNKQPLGYTIVEVMIVLAVSGMMFVVAADFINGKQERSSFTAGVNEMASEIQDVVEQVTDGRYSDIPLNCNYAGGAITFVGATSAQGTNSSCVFLGKIIRIPSQASLDQYNVFSIAGGRLDSTDSAELALGPNAGDPTIATALNTIQAIPSNLELPAGAQTLTAYDTLGAPHPTTTAFGFIQSQGVADAANNDTTFQTGAQTLSLVYIPNLLVSSADSVVNNNFSLASKVDICLTDDTQYAKITVGSNNNQLSVNVTRYSPGVPCS